VLVYAHASGATVEKTIESVAQHVAAGCRAIRAQCSIPGVPDAYGVSKKDRPYEPAERGQAAETVWNTERYLEFVPGLFERLRREFGPHLHLLHDVHHRLTPIEAGRLGRQLEGARLFWMEDPVPAELQEGFRLIRQHTTTPLAVGEVFNSIYDCELLIREQLIDYIRMAVAHAGGLSHLRKIAALGEVYHVKTGCHGATDLSPVCMAAALHFGLSVHNFGIQEHMPHNEETERVFPHAYSFEDGAMHPGDAPGLGVELDEALAASSPYQAAYLPIARKEDGTLHSW
jgi:mannonate dehydratase